MVRHKDYETASRLEKMSNQSFPDRHNFGPPKVLSDSDFKAPVQPLDYKGKSNSNRRESKFKYWFQFSTATCHSPGEFVLVISFAYSPNKQGSPRRVKVMRLINIKQNLYLEEPSFIQVEFRRDLNHGQSCSCSISCRRILSSHSDILLLLPLLSFIPLLSSEVHRSGRTWSLGV